MNSAEKWKADFEFRWKQSLNGGAKNLELSTKRGCQFSYLFGS